MLVELLFKRLKQTNILFGFCRSKDRITEMEFKDLNSSSGLNALNEHLATRSYITGVEPSQNDLLVFRSIPLDLPKEKGPSNVKRWYMHIKSFSSDQMKSFSLPKEKVKITPQEGSEVKKMFHWKSLVFTFGIFIFHNVCLLFYLQFILVTAPLISFCLFLFKKSRCTISCQHKRFTISN